MNQAMDSTKPTWKLGAEFRLSVGKPMRFDPMAPEANKGVSEGLQQLKLWTSFGRRLAWAEPWVELHWLVPLTGKSALVLTDEPDGSAQIEWLKGHFTTLQQVDAFSITRYGVPLYSWRIFYGEGLTP